MRSGLLFSALALAALLPVYAAPHVNFLDFSHTGKPAGVQHATGYPLLAATGRRVRLAQVRVGAHSSGLPV